MARSVDPADRFGISLAALRTARSETAIGMRWYVPTRQEVGTLSGDLLYHLLDVWFRRSPQIIVPTVEQVSEVQEVLEGRPDRDACQDLIDLCNAFRADPQSFQRRDGARSG